MAEWNSRANDIFLGAAEVESPTERQLFLDQQCGNDAGLRAQVESLLAASAKVGSFLNQPAVQALAGSRGTADYEPITERPGTVIGPYKLMEAIGEGGMGLVFVAEQQQPVRRKVALKLIKPGMDSKQVIARFEAERQALAMMDHQNIAKVLDAGTTESGRPYFVMELVQGTPITEYCDANKLTPRERLELFVPVCHAIQHAHQKGIIHRDIKPSNILVTMYDDRPVPKVIDFGVAKAIEQRLTEKTIYTQFGTLVGTFEYMSPEQAEMNAFGVDTRSDVYALGVLLYELLTGTTPLERQRLREIAFGEVVRLIKEEEPPRPSVRLSASGALAKVAAARKTDPARLSRLVRGELDWVVMRCLEKDRTRRYDTASGVARDVERYLKDEPVEAGPPSAMYRLRKLLQRNKGIVLTTAVVLAVSSCAGYFAYDSWRKERERQAAEVESGRKLRDATMQRAQERILQGDIAGAEDAINAAATLGAPPEWVDWRRGQIAYHQGRLAPAFELLQRAAEKMPQNIAVRALLASAAIWSQRWDRYIIEVDAVAHLAPQTTEELLYLGLMQSYRNPLEGRKTLDLAIRRQPSLTGFVLRAQVRADEAMQTSSPEIVKLAIQDANSANSILEDNVNALSMGVWVHLIAAALCDPKDEASRAEHHRQAGAFVERLQQYPLVPASLLLQAMYYDQIGDRPSALKTWQKGATPAMGFATAYALALYRAEKLDVDQLVSVVDRSLTSTPLDQGTRAMLLMERPDRIAEARAIFKEQYLPHLPAWAQVCERTYFDFWLGDIPKAKAGLLAAGTTMKGAPATIREGYAQQCQFLKNPSRTGADRWLKALGKSQRDLCTAHYFIGVYRLAEGDRQGAREHFQAVVGTGVFYQDSYDWARACLARMQQDPEWPRWMKNAKKADVRQGDKP